jgi:hypothetical protein
VAEAEQEWMMVNFNGRLARGGPAAVVCASLSLTACTALGSSGSGSASGSSSSNVTVTFVLQSPY